jgi:DNA repair protein RadC
MNIYHVKLVKEELNGDYYRKVSSPSDAGKILKEYIGYADREHFVVLCLNTKNKITGIHTVSIGSLNSSLVHPREVFKVALLSNSASIIVGHNHPSGDTTPSQEDREVTQRLKKAGKLLGIEILDHLIIGDGTYSFATNGEL